MRERQGLLPLSFSDSPLRNTDCLSALSFGSPSKHPVLQFVKKCVDTIDILESLRDFNDEKNPEQNARARRKARQIIVLLEKEAQFRRECGRLAFDANG